ncbi:MAG: hypothetical protein ACKODH_08055 [Limisphaerales bacterium]
MNRRRFLRHASLTAAALAANALPAPAQVSPSGDRPSRADGVTVINPRSRVPVGLIIDDSTCLVNLNRFAMPQFNEVYLGANKTYQRNWRDWPVEIPDKFLRAFNDWAVGAGVRGKFSIVPFPACVGRLDRELPGWSRRELADSLKLVREEMAPHWDLTPEMVTHTRVIDLKTGHPYPEVTPKFMENWEWTTGKSADEIGAYLAYALQILKDAGLPADGITTPGGFGKKARAQMSLATLQACRSVFGTEIPHYFTDLFTEPGRSVAPVVQNASGLDGPDPRCVVYVPGCTGDWTAGWDCTPPGGADKFITADGKSGRMVEVIQSGEPALMFGHWTGIYFNGYEVGFKILQDVVKRLQARFDNLLWMKNSEVARYWAAKELTRIERAGNTLNLRAPFACPDFTLRVAVRSTKPPQLRVAVDAKPLTEVTVPLKLTPGTWCRDGEATLVCIALPKGTAELQFS